MENPLLNVAEVATLLGTTRENVFRRCQRGRLPHIKMGRRTFIPRVAWEQWLATQNATALANMNGVADAE